MHRTIQHFMWAFCVAAVSYLAFAWSPDAEKTFEFMHARDHRMWHIVLALQPVVWLASVLFARRAFSELAVVRPRAKPGRWWWPPLNLVPERGLLIAFSVLVVVLSAGPALLSTMALTELGDGIDVASKLPYHSEKILLATLLACASSAVLAALLVAAQRSLGASGRDEDRVATFFRVSALTEEAMIYLGATIGLATLSTGLLRNIVNAEAVSAAIEGIAVSHGDPAYKYLLDAARSAEPFSMDLVLGYGLFFSLLVAMFYVPIHRALQEEGTAIAELIAKTPTPQLEPAAPSGDWDDFFRRHAAVEKWLGVGERSWPEAVRARISILGPLIGGILSLGLG